jgi:hypothetical protein
MNNTKFDTKKGKVCKKCKQRLHLTLYRHFQKDYEVLYLDICKICERFFSKKKYPKLVQGYKINMRNAKWRR